MKEGVITRDLFYSFVYPTRLDPKLRSTVRCVLGVLVHYVHVRIILLEKGASEAVFQKRQVNTP